MGAVTWAVQHDCSLWQDGIHGIFFRGLSTRVFTNILQSAFFTVLWKYLSSR